MPHFVLLHGHPKGTRTWARWSSIAAVASFLGVTPVTGIGAQVAPGPTPAQLDSIRQRLEDAEAAIEALREQLATEASTALRARSRVALEFRGRVLVNAFTNSQYTNNADVPLFAFIASAPEPVSGFAMAMRQTQLGLAFSATEIAGGTFRGDLDVDFFGGQNETSGGRHFPLLRLRTARGSLEWSRGSVMVGQEQPLITGVDPVSLASIGTPGFTAAGNLWLWLPQVRGAIHTRGAVRLGLEAAVLAPTNGGNVGGDFNTVFDAAERTGTPFLQALARLSWGDEDRPGTFSLGVHNGRLRLDSLRVRSEAVAATLVLPLGKRLELRGEAFDGQVLHVLGGGGIGQGVRQSFAPPTATPVRAVGAWAQANAQLTSRWLVGAGVGVDDPEDDDLSPTGRLKNATTEAHVHWRPAGPMVLGFEWRRTATTYAAETRTNRHLNLAVGFEF